MIVFQAHKLYCKNSGNGKFNLPTFEPIGSQLHLSTLSKATPWLGGEVATVTCVCHVWVNLSIYKAITPLGTLSQCFKSKPTSHSFNIDQFFQLFLHTALFVHFAVILRGKKKRWILVTEERDEIQTKQLTSKQRVCII